MQTKELMKLIDQTLVAIWENEIKSDYECGWLLKEDTLKNELNKVAIEAKKNAPKHEKTCYFERAKMKKEAMRVAKEKSKLYMDKSKSKEKQEIE